jgi:hypothetical protein
LNGAEFREISAEAGVDNNLDGRGIAVGDFDNDGHLDLFQTNADQRALLYRNVSKNTGNWVELRLAGTKSNRDAVGARVVLTAGGLTQIREVDGGNGYAGQSMRRIHFGIGKSTAVEKLEIHWPSGLVQQVGPVPINALTPIVEGAGAHH